MTCDIVKVENNENMDGPQESVSSVGFFYARKRVDVADKLGISRHDIGQDAILSTTWADCGITSGNVLRCR